MVNSYLLVNPSLKGKFNTSLKARNSKEAANMFYTNLSLYFNNSIPEFHFSLQKGLEGHGKYYHFKVQEKRKKNEVKFEIVPYELPDATNLTSFKTKVDEFHTKFNDPVSEDDQAGGKKKSKKKSKSIRKKEDRSDSESSVSSDYIYKRVKSYIPVNKPIYYWWYDPYLYGLDYVYVPTFYSYLTPYIELSLK